MNGKAVSTDTKFWCHKSKLYHLYIFGKSLSLRQQSACTMGKKKITVAEFLGLTKLTKIINIGCWYNEKNEILYIPIIINYWMPYSKEH